MRERKEGLGTGAVQVLEVVLQEKTWEGLSRVHTFEVQSCRQGFPICASLGRGTWSVRGSEEGEGSGLTGR